MKVFIVLRQLFEAGHGQEYEPNREVVAVCATRVEADAAVARAWATTLDRPVDPADPGAAPFDVEVEEHWVRPATEWNGALKAALRDDLSAFDDALWTTGHLSQIRNAEAALLALLEKAS